MADRGATYRDVIDRLVSSCREGQGQIGARRVRAGLWNANADALPDEMPDQKSMNDLLLRLSSDDREVLALMLAQEYVGGVHDSLVALYEARIPPFEDGYEGTPYHDFVGRLADWP